MYYYTQKLMTLELTKEEMSYCRKFARFLNEYANEINDDMNIICDLITVMENVNGSEPDKDVLKMKFDIDIRLKEN